MDFQTTLCVLLFVIVVTSMAVRRVRRAWLMRNQREELHRAERLSSPEQLKTMKARHAFERGDNTKAMRYLHKKLPDP